MAQYIDKDKVIEYIKQRLIPTVNHGNIDDWERGADNERINFLSYIDSLPEEPTVKGITWKDVNTLHTLINQVRYEFPNGISEKSFGLAVLERFQDCQDDIKNPVSGDLDEELNKWRHNHFHGRRDKDASGEYLERKSQLDLARHFAEWQKQQDYKIYAHIPLKDIHDAWQELKKNKPDIENYPAVCFQKGADWRENHMKELFKTEYEKGRFDMREEMIKDAISCNVDWYDGFRLDYTQEQQDDILLKLGADVGDKVKIIIVKEEQQ